MKTIHESSNTSSTTNIIWPQHKPQYPPFHLGILVPIGLFLIGFVGGYGFMALTNWLF
jgi:hypothetical protein